MLKLAQHQYWYFLEENIPNGKLTHKMIMTDSIKDDTIGYTVLEDVVINQCLIYEIKNNFICTHKYWRQKKSAQAT